MKELEGACVQSKEQAIFTPENARKFRSDMAKLLGTFLIGFYTDNAIIDNIEYAICIIICTFQFNLNVAQSNFRIFTFRLQELLFGPSPAAGERLMEIDFNGGEDGIVIFAVAMALLQDLHRETRVPYYRDNFCTVALEVLHGDRNVHVLDSDMDGMIGNCKDFDCLEEEEEETIINVANQ